MPHLPSAQPLFIVFNTFWRQVLDPMRADLLLFGQFGFTEVYKTTQATLRLLETSKSLSPCNVKNHVESYCLNRDSVFSQLVQ